jgi:Spy/CpxP family protein refolding chaperone
MKRLLLACCLGAVMAAAQAQPQLPSTDQRLAHMQKSLQLTDAQTKKIKPILDTAEQQRAALADKYKISEFKDFRADAKKLQEQTRAQIATILTPAQVQALDAQHEHHRPHGGFGAKGGKPGPDTADAAH